MLIITHCKWCNTPLTEILIDRFDSKDYSPYKVSTDLCVKCATINKPELRLELMQLKRDVEKDNKKDSIKTLNRLIDLLKINTQ